ncbi:MAG: protein kinase [Saprospiraceae bacterium]|nr:protein kinase [Saprospiraceae bacterium]
MSNNKNRYRSEYDVLNLTSQLCAGLNDLHRNGFVHRDFKPENILFDQYNTAKLCDFDISGRFGLKDTRLTTMNDSGEVVEVYGTLAYSAPEQMDPKGAYKYLGPQMDLFSLGVTLYEVLSGGKLPFGTYQEIKDTPLKYTKRIKTKKYQPISEWRYDLSTKWSYFFEKTLEPDPAKRPSKINEVLEMLDIDMPNSKFKSSESNEPNTLIVRSGDNIGAIFSLEKLFRDAGKNIIRIGRRDEGNNFNEINLDETQSSYISRKHATIEKIGNRHYIRDGQWNMDSSKPNWTFSLNGTYLNNSKLLPNESRLLESEDIISLGNVILQYFF